MTRVLAFVLLASTLGQQSGSQAFAGRWAADYQGRPLVRLDLTASSGALAGRLQIANLHVDAKGDVETDLSDLPEPRPLLDVTVRNQTVAFSCRDDNDVDQFELSMIDDRTAELRFVLSEADRRELAQEGIPVPKPIRLTRLPQ
jgi:hypothetical protein